MDPNGNTRAVSVVMCTFNGAKYLREQMDSLLAQTYPLHEIIVQDDGSTDETIDIIKSYPADNIKLYINKEKLGATPNFYSAMRKATGELIAICDQDDIWEPYKVEHQVRAIGDKLLCVAHTKPFSDDGSQMHFDGRVPNCNLLRMTTTSMEGHRMLLNRKLVNLVPLDSCDFVRERAYDGVLAVTAAAFDSIVYVDEVLSHWRRYRQATSYVARTNDGASVNGALYRVKWCLQNYSRAGRVMGKHYQQLAEYLQKLGSTHPICEEAMHYMALQQSHNPIDMVRLVAFCLKNRRRLFYAAGDDSLKSLASALTFPLTNRFPFRYRLE